jgi:hypothetical protein
MASSPANVDLVRAGRSALDWLADQRSYFLAPAAASLTADTAKPLGELGVLLATLSRAPSVLSGRGHRAYDALVDVLAAAGRLSGLRFRPARNQWTLVLHALLFVTLDDAGSPDCGYHRDVVRRALAAGTLDNIELFPYQLMEARLILDWGGFSHGLPKWPELAASAMVSRRPDTLMLTARTAYQVTHDIMFLTGLDPRRGLPEPSPLDVQAIEHLLADLIVFYAGRRHWDLLGELLLCWDLLGLPPSRVQREGWSLFLAQQASDGSFAGPSRSASDDDHRESTGVEARFRQRYHTTLVAVLAINASLRWGQRTAGNADYVRPVHATGPGDLVLNVGQDAAWLRGLLDLPDSQQDSSVASGVLVGTYLCGAVDPAVESTVPEVAARVAVALAGPQRWERVPPALALTVHAVLALHGCAVPELAAFVERIRDVLASRPPTSAAADLELCEKRLLLHGLGLADRPPLLSPAQLDALVRALPLRASSDDLATVLLAVGSATGYGTLDHKRGAATEEITALLLGYAVREFRAGDLATGCALVRAANHLVGLSRNRATRFVDHIQMQQRPDGGYGLVIGPEAALEVRLPMTLACLWTLAELRDDFRLYRVHRRGG